MDENNASAAPATDPSAAPVSTVDPSPVAEDTTPPEPANDPASPAETTPAENNEPQGDPDKTEGDTVPEKGIDPDKGVDPNAPDNPQPSDQVDFSKMSREERKEFFQNAQKQQEREVFNAVDQAYQPQSVEELTQAYMDEGYDQFQATMLAKSTHAEQANQISTAKAEMAELKAGLATEAIEVITTIPWLNSSNADQYDKDSTEAASYMYEQLCLVKDPRTNQVVEAKMTPSQFYGLMDKIRGSGSAKAALQAQKNAERQLAAVAPATSTTSSREPAFEDLSSDQMAERLRASGHVF